LGRAEEGSEEFYGAGKRGCLFMGSNTGSGEGQQQKRTTTKAYMRGQLLKEKAAHFPAKNSINFW